MTTKILLSILSFVLFTHSVIAQYRTPKSWFMEVQGGKIDQLVPILAYEGNYFMAGYYGRNGKYGMSYKMGLEYLKGIYSNNNETIVSENFDAKIYFKPVIFHITNNIFFWDALMGAGIGYEYINHGSRILMDGNISNTNMLNLNTSVGTSLEVFISPNISLNGNLTATYRLATTLKPLTVITSFGLKFTFY